MLSLDQEVFAKEIVHRLGQDQEKPAATPLSSQEKLTKFDGESDPATVRDYQRIIGSLMYLMLGTRPDLAYAVGKLSRFSSNPSDEHALAIIRTVQYVCGTTHLCLNYTRSNHGNPIGFTDSDWAGDTSDSKSTAGYLFMIGDAVFSWYSKKQGHVSTSTADAEYTALFRGGEQAFWLRQLYQQIGLPFSAPLKLYCDNKSAIAIAKNQGTHSKSKAIRIEFHAVRDRINRHEIEVEYVRSKDNTADILTKSLPRDLFFAHRNSLGLTNVSEAITFFDSSNPETSDSTQHEDAFSP